MHNLVAIHEARDAAYYGDLLHPDYQMFLQPSTQQEFPDLGPTLDRAEEVRIAERMFGGVSVTDPLGQTVPGISAISFQTFEQQGTWAASPPTDVIPNTRSALFDLTILWARPGYSTLPVDGQAKFYVAGRDSLHNGTNQTYWQIIGLQDFTSGIGKTVEMVTWGSVKGLFR